MAKRKEGPTITVTFEGAADDNGDVRLQDFVEKVTAFFDALRSVESLLPDETRERMYYRIVSLSHNSPAEMTVAPVARREVSKKAAVKAFASAMATVVEHPGAKRAVPQLLLPFARFVPTSDKHISRMTVKVGGVRSRKVVLFPQRPDWIPEPKLQLAEVEYSYGSVAGRLEQLNVHEGANRFTLWPKIGPRVQGAFSPEMKTRIAAGFDRYVRIYGRLKFETGQHYPTEIDQLSDIEVYELDKELPRFQDLRGIAPDATGGMNIRDFVESLYDGE